MTRAVTATEARVHLGALMREVAEEGQTVIVERDGQPYVVMLSKAQYDRLNRGEAAQKTREVLQEAAQLWKRIDARRQGKPLPPPEELLDQIREERDREIDESLR